MNLMIEYDLEFYCEAFAGLCRKNGITKNKIVPMIPQQFESIGRLTMTLLKRVECIFSSANFPLRCSVLSLMHGLDMGN